MKMYQLEVVITEDNEIMLIQDDAGGEDRILLSRDQALLVGRELLNLAAVE